MKETTPGKGAREEAEMEMMELGVPGKGAREEAEMEMKEKGAPDEAKMDEQWQIERE